MRTARAAADAVRRGATTSVALVEEALARIAETDDVLRAFVAVDAARALAEARARDASPATGPLHGVPVAVKDLLDVAGDVTTAGSLLPPGPPASADAEAVRRLRAAGAVVVGRTRTHEFAWGLTTQHPVTGGTRNPRDPSRVPGGSSGGSAAAVAAGVVPLALGTDTAGSIRLPAAWCGVVGHKPTWGLVPTEGAVPLSPSCDVVGPIALDVDDARLALEVLTAQSFPRSGRQIRYGVPLTWPRCDTSVRAAVEAAVAPLRPVAVALPDPDELVEAFLDVQAAEALAWHRGTGRWPEHAERYGADVAARLRLAETRPAPDPARRDRLRAAALAAFAEVDVVVLPVAGAGPSRTAEPDVVHVDGEPSDLRSAVLAFTLLASLCGLPATAVPVGHDRDGLPVGAQVVGPPGADALVLEAAERLVAR